MLASVHSLNRVHASAFTPGFSKSGSKMDPGCSRTRMLAQAVRGSSTKLAIIGDVHGQWSAADEVALRCLGADMALFVGDFGEEAVDLVAQIASVKMPKAVILGNHDAWYSLKSHRQSSKARKQSGAMQAVAPSVAVGTGTMDSRVESSLRRSSGAADLLMEPGVSSPRSCVNGGGRDEEEEEEVSCKVAMQFQLLGGAHVGYSSLEVPPLSLHGNDGDSELGSSGGASSSSAMDAGNGRRGFTVVGGRPFSSGGKSLSMTRTFYEQWYGISTVEESRQRIVATGMKYAPESSLILLAHNGPSGLGTLRHNICGVDWTNKAGDHGDQDLADAISDLHSLGAHIPLVTFGHMHHILRGGKPRQMVAVDPLHGTVYLNAATVPRVRRSAVQNTGGTFGLMQHHFLLVTLEEGEVQSASDVWCEVTPPREPALSQVLGRVHRDGVQAGDLLSDMSDSDGWSACIVEERPVLKTEKKGDIVAKMYFNAHTQAWLAVKWPPTV